MEAPKFDIDKELNNGKFLEFLAKHDDADSFDMSDEAKLKERFEVFNIKETVKQEIKDLYKTEINEKLGVEVNDKDLESVDVFLEKKALTNPEYVIALNGQINSFKVLPGQIETLKTELSTLGSKNDLEFVLDKTREKRDKLGEMSEAYNWTTIGKHGINILSRGYFFEDAKRKRDLVKEFKESGEVNNERKRGDMYVATTEECARIKAVVTKIKELEGQKNQLEEDLKNLKTGVFGLAGGLGDLSKIIQEKAVKTIKDLTEKTADLESLDKASKKLLQFRAADRRNDFELEMFEDEAGKQKLIETVNAKTEKKVRDLVEGAVEAINLGDQHFSQFERVISVLASRKDVGSKTGEEVKEFIKNSLYEEHIKLTGTDTDSKAKKIMIARVLVKLG